MISPIGRRKRPGSGSIYACLLYVTATLSLLANAMGDMPSHCDDHGIAQAMTARQIQRAFSLSIECEVSLLRQPPNSWADSSLRRRYFATAQILIAQGKFDAASARIAKAEILKRSKFLDLDVLENEHENLTKGFLLERSGRQNEAVLFYLLIAEPYAHARLAIIYLDRGQTDDAAEAAWTAFDRDPANPTASVVLGALTEKTNPSFSLFLYKNAIASASRGDPTLRSDPSTTPLYYLELYRAIAAIARLESKP